MTLKQISYVTGFSTSTVSKALNNKRDINVETKKLIQDIAVKNNYIPNKNAISLRNSKSYIIAVILPQVNNSIYSEALFTMQKVASNSGYRIILFQSFNDEVKEKQYLDEINDGSVDGAILLSVIKNSNRENTNTSHNIPREYLQVTENHNLQDIKEQCINNFEQLLKQIK